MAESQDACAYDDELLAALEQAISPARFAPYLAAAGDDRKYAIQLYLWNARIAKAFLYPLHMAEITTRNAMHAAFPNLPSGEGRREVQARVALING
jgi:hypothetical protein